MADTGNKGNGIFDTISNLLGASKVDQSTGQTTATNTQHAFADSVQGLGTLISGSGLGQQLMGKLDDLKSLSPQQIQAVLDAIGKSADPAMQSAHDDLKGVQANGEAFVSKLQGYAAQLKQLLPTILPVLEGILSGKK